MGFLEMIVTIVALKTAADVLKAVLHREQRKADAKLVAEVEALRTEVRELRRQHQDTILSFDSTLDRFDRRMDRLECHSEQSSRLSGGEERLPEREPVATGRLYG
jgi:hypothetical protein